ncbi:MAG: thioester reductase domain-containing protein [Desulfobacter sp.]
MIQGKDYILKLLRLARNDSQLEALTFEKSVRDAAYQPDLTYDKVIAAYFDGYKNRPALGQRRYQLEKNDRTGKNERCYQPAYDTVTYQDLHDRVKALAMSWRMHPQCLVGRDEFVCIIGFASVEFAIVDIACAYAKAVTVPLSGTLPEADLMEILSNVAPVVLASTIQDLDLCTALAIKQQSIKTLLVFDYDERVDEEKRLVENAKSKLRESGVATSLFVLNDLIAYGREQDFSFLQAEERENDETAIILHSSGSTGKPKGACISAEAMINAWKRQPKGLPRITVIMAPFNHFMGRDAMYATFNVGGTAYFTLKPDMSTLFEDIRLVRPTALEFFPRILELIYRYYQNEVNQRVKSGNAERTDIEKTVKAEMKSEYLGDRLVFGTVSSAPTSPKIKAFIVDCFDILLKEAYSNTEAGSGGVALDGKIIKKMVAAYRLKDVPELGYFTSDTPYPRGELCVKTKFGITRYYKQPEATAALLDEDGFSLTGDIVEERGPGQIRIIDRKKDVIKLSQGEYVAVGPLGKRFEGGSVLIDQIYIYGNSHRSYLLAVVVPEMGAAEKMLHNDVTDGKLKKIIRNELHRVGRKELKNFEIPRDFIIEKEKFTRANGLLSAVGKYLRPAIKQKYGHALEEMYKAHDRIKDAEIKALADPNSRLNTREKFIKLLESTLGIKDFETTKPKTFKELGGDSLGAALLSMSIEEIFGVSLSGDMILSPEGNIRQWVKIIEDAGDDKNDPLSFASIHGKESTIVYKEDLKLDRFIDSSLLHHAPHLPESSQPPQTVLLTGANGFLGHILCLKWMEKLAKAGGTLFCIIRARDDNAARKRLDDTFMGMDSEMEAAYKTLSEKHLEVLAGDISEPFLGLTKETFNRLSKKIDRICHVAALVNHRLAYRHLFRPNVIGTAEVIRFGITQKKKPIDFVSTIGVQSLLDKNNGNNESAQLKHRVKLMDYYAAGYITSKWAAEHLLNNVHLHTGMTVNIFRCDLIMPDQKYKGQINVEDMLTRLLFSMIATGLSPRSFYQRNENGSKISTHYDGIPVDVLSDTIVGLSNNGHNRCRIFNGHNYLNKGVSLDGIVELIKRAGYSIHQIDDYRKWYEIIEAKLRTLPAEKQRYSILDIMAAYRRPHPSNNRIPDCTNFKTLARSVYGGKDIPRLSEGYIYKYLNDMETLGLIKRPV